MTTATRVLRDAAGEAVERALGVSTRTAMTPEQAGIPAGFNVRYVPSSWLGTLRSLRALGIGPDDVLLDYGSGAGRVLLVATRLPFRRILGLELSERLLETAGRNVARASRRRRADRIELIRGDAARWPVPDDVTVVYMFCPFTGPVFSGAVEQLLASIERRPRRMRLVYRNPVEHDKLIRTGRFTPAQARHRRRVPLRRGAPPSTITYEIR